MTSKQIIILAVLLLTMTLPAGAAPPISAVQVELVGAPKGDPVSDSIVEALRKLLRGIELRDVTAIGDCLSKRVIMIDDRNSNVVFGKEQVLDHIKTNVIGNKSAPPVKKITVYDPFIRVKNGTAMVSFRAVKTMADAPATKLESLCSEVFERQGNDWLVLQFRSKWQPVK
jgi:hypothetical protein